SHERRRSTNCEGRAGGDRPMSVDGRRTATLLCLSSRQELSGGLVQESVDVAGKVPLEHAAHVPSAMALVDVRRDVVPGAFIVLGAVQDDAVESSVQLSVSEPVQPVPGGLARG